jgi:hypothetical protein
MALDHLSGATGVATPTQTTTGLTNSTYVTDFVLSSGLTLTFSRPNYGMIREIQILTKNTGGTFDVAFSNSTSNFTVSSTGIACDGTWKIIAVPLEVTNNYLFTFTNVTSATILSIKAFVQPMEFSHEKEQLATNSASTVDASTSFLAQFAITSDESLFGYADTSGNKGRIVPTGGPFNNPFFAVENSTNPRTNLIATQFTNAAPGNWTISGSPAISTFYPPLAYAWGVRQILNAAISSPAIALANSTQYTLSFWVRSELDPANVTVEIIRVTGSGTATLQSPALSSLGYSSADRGSWKFVSTTFTSAADVAGSTYVVQFRQSAVASTTSAFASFWIMSAQLETGSYPTAFKPDGATPTTPYARYECMGEMLGQDKDFTISGWFKPEIPTTVARARLIWSMGSSTTNRTRLYLTATNQLEMASNDPGFSFNTGATIVDVTKWNHFACQFNKYGTLGNSGTMEIYLNGSLAATTTGISQANLANPNLFTQLILGQNVFVGGFYGEMYFSGFRVDQRRLSASEIESLANQTGPYMNKGVHRIAQ